MFVLEPDQLLLAFPVANLSSFPRLVSTRLVEDRRDRAAPGWRRELPAAMRDSGVVSPVRRVFPAKQACRRAPARVSRESREQHSGVAIRFESSTGLQVKGGTARTWPASSQKWPRGKTLRWQKGKAAPDADNEHGDQPEMHWLGATAG